MVRLVRAAALAALVLAASAAGAGAQESVLIRVPPGVDAGRAHPTSEPTFGSEVVERERARAAGTGAALSPVARWVTVAVPTRARAKEVVAAFEGRAGYRAELPPRVAPPPAACRDLGDAPGYPLDLGDDVAVPDLASLQDARTLLGIPGTADARGAGVGVIDVELEWDDTHEDLPPGLPDDPDPPNTRVPDDGDAPHGTAVLGIIGARDDGVGTTGLAPDATLRPVSPYSSGAYDLVGALGGLLEGPEAPGAGDVVLIELQAFPQGKSDVVGPVELSQSVRDAISDLVEDGVVVVEPAGNGDLASSGSGRDLAAPPFALPGGSGAIVVGAGDRAGDPAARGNGDPLGNHGARVDVQGLGEGVVTTGAGSLVQASGSARDYTHCFDGTSSASATVAGGVASLQSASMAIAKRPLTPAEVRGLLVSTGTPQPQASAAAAPIGPRPDIAAARGLLVAPPVIIDGPAQGASVADAPGFTISAAAGVTIEWTLTGPIALSGQGATPSIGAIDSADGANDGEYTLTVIARRASGPPSAPVSRTFTLDNPDPPPPATAPPVAPSGATGGTATPTPRPQPQPAPPPTTPAPVPAATTAGVPPAAVGGRAAASALVERAAVRSVSARWSRRSGRLVLRLGGLAPRARVRFGGKALRVRKGIARTTRSRPGSALLVVRAPSSRSTRMLTTRHRVVLTPGGAARVRRDATRGRVVRPAARRVRVLLDRNRGEATFTLSGLARRARVRLGGTRLRVSRRVARIPWTGEARGVLVVTAPSSKRLRVTRVRYRVTLPASGRPVLRRV